MLPAFTALMMSISLVKIVLPAYSTCQEPLERVVSSLQSQSNTVAARSGGTELCARIIFFGPPLCAIAGAPSAIMPANPLAPVMKRRRVVINLRLAMRSSLKLRLLQRILVGSSERYTIGTVLGSYAE